MAQKEKAIYEMVDSLNGRLDKLNRTVRSQHDLCVNDVNPNNVELGNGEGGGGWKSEVETSIRCSFFRRRRTGFRVVDVNEFGEPINAAQPHE